MDLQGQRNAEWLYLILLLGGAVPAFLGGWFTGSMKLMFIIYAAFSAVAVLAVVPDWPIYNRHPLKWLPKGRGTKQLPSVQPAVGGLTQRSPTSKQRK